MFFVEPEKHHETFAERERRRASMGTDRKGLKDVARALTMIFGGMVILYAADVAGVERRQTTATVVGFIDRWTMKRGHECVTVLTTGFGYAQIYTRNLCHDASWHLGDRADMEARRLRLTRTIVLTTKDTIFHDAYNVLPHS